jgi:hypothetical protein
MRETQIGHGRNFIKLKSFIHFGRWNVHFINLLNPMILTQQKSNQPWPRPEHIVKHHKSIEMAQHNLYIINQLKIKLKMHLN